MYYHIIPSYFADCPERKIELMELSVPELGLHLTKEAGELQTCKPYPNERYSVGYLQKESGQEHQVGLVAKTEKLVLEFTKTCIWSVHPLPAEADLDVGICVSHVTKYHLLDDDFLIFSDDSILQGAWVMDGMILQQNRKYQSLGYCDKSVMEFRNAAFEGLNIKDVYNNLGNLFGKPRVITEREQDIYLYTVNEHIYTEQSKVNECRYPVLTSAFETGL